jgi:hypothetical protein
VRPDGTLSYAGKYMTGLLQHAGQQLPKHTQQASPQVIR